MVRLFLFLFALKVMNCIYQKHTNSHTANQKRNYVNCSYVFRS